MNWQTLNSREKNSAIAAAVLLIIVVLYSYIFAPIWQQGERLTRQLNNAQAVGVYLNQAQQKLSSSPQHKTLSKPQAKSYITSVFRAEGTKLNGLIMRNHQSIININSIQFSKLLRALRRLKHKNGIIATKVVIKRIDTGIVSANLTLSYL